MPTKKTASKTNKNNKPYLVSILMGSASDWDTMMASKTMLDELNISSDMRVLSAHRTPDQLGKYLKKSLAQGTEVFIAAAGMAAHLAGVVASQTIKPVIGVPLKGPNLDGLDALLSTVQMPGGIPVATVAIGKAGAKNAAILAAQMLGIKNSKIAEQVQSQRKKASREVLIKGEHLAMKERNK